MRAVITGTDYIKDIDGSFKAIETNTNIGLAVDITRYFNADEFTQFVSASGFTNIHVIHNTPNLQYFYGPVELEPANLDFSNIGCETSLMGVLNYAFSGSEVQVEQNVVHENSVSIPEIEDSETTLIIRIAYDATSIIDDTYARDNWEFLKLMHDSNPSSIAKTYINDSELGFDSIGDDIRDNGNHPNYCVKKRITPANNNIYPKLYKISTIQELNDLKAGLEMDEYLQEYICNTSDTLNNKLKVYRSVDMVYGPELDIMNLWVVEGTNLMDIIDTPDYDNDNQIQIWDRNRYTTKYNEKTDDIAIKLSADTNTKILDINNNIVTIDDLNVGDAVKSIKWPGVRFVPSGSTITDFTGSVDRILNDFNVTSSAVLTKVEQEYFGEIIEFELENGARFSDVGHAMFLVEKEVSGSTIVAGFERYEMLENTGSNVFVWDNETNSIQKSKITNIWYSYQKLTAFTLDVGSPDLFLTLEESDNNRYGLVTHNYTYDCRNYSCPSFGVYVTCTLCGSGDFTNCHDTYSPKCCRDGSFFYFVFEYRTVIEQNYTKDCQLPFFYYVPHPFIPNAEIQIAACDPADTPTAGSYCNGQKPSDINLKKDIKFLYKKNELSVYKFTYTDEIKKLWNTEYGESLEGEWIGTIAQDLIDTKWESALVKNPKGFYVINYDLLPLITE